MGASKSGGIKNTKQPSTASEHVLERRRINIQKVRNVLLICLNNNTDDTNKDWHQTIVELQRAVSNVITFSDSDQCIEFIKTIDDNKVCMIISASLGQHFMPRVHDISHVDSVFIFSNNKQHDEQWAKVWSKIRGVYTDITPFCEALKQADHHCEQNAMPLSFVASKKNVDQLDQSFIYTRILKEIILTSNSEEKHIKEFIAYCRELFADNEEELIHVKALESKYRNETPIWWYSCDSFLGPMLNRALRMMNGDIITRMVFYIADLHRHIEKLHREQYASQSPSEIFKVYYGQGLSKVDFEQLKKSQGGLIAFNNFLLTSKNSELSLSFAQDTATKGDLVGIMFIMKIDPSQASTPFASIRDVSHSQTQDEVLFSMHTVFRINEIKRLTANNRLQEVYLTLISDNDKELAVLTNHIRQESCSEKEGWHRLGAALIKMRHLGKAEQIYQFLLSQTEEVSKKAAIYDQLGWIKDDQEKYPEAITFYEKSLAIYQKTPTTNHLDLANAYYYIGTAYYNTGNYPKALSSHKEALKIREQSLPSDHLDLAKSYGNIGLVYGSMDDYPAALSYLEKDLVISQKTLPSNHPDLTMSYMNIGMVSYNMDDYSKALTSYEKALAIQQKSLPSNHPDLAKIYNNIGLVYNSMSDYPKALSCHEKALAIREKALPQNHPDVGTSFNNIGVTYENMGNHSKACSFLERAVEVGEHSLPSNHPTLQIRRDNLERVKEKL